ncbi:MAG TPA: MarR family transcriptional regulator [Povalibacter sp.]|nr:MarR family transcriptional regulator [Povalibacter sp.]
MDRSSGQKGNRSLASLLRAARHTYSLAIRAPLADAGFEDIPRDGVFVIAAIRTGDVSAGDLQRRLGVSKQAVSQLLDTLVLRGYVERSIHTEDRRRMTLTLTRRGERVATVCRRAVDQVEQRIVEIVGTSYVEHTRATLTALIELAAEWQPDTPSLTGR